MAALVNVMVSSPQQSIHAQYITEPWAVVCEVVQGEMKRTGRRRSSPLYFTMGLIHTVQVTDTRYEVVCTSFIYLRPPL